MKTVLTSGSTRSDSANTAVPATVRHILGNLPGTPQNAPLPVGAAAGERAEVLV